MPADIAPIAIAGATGAVGREALRILESWGIPADRLALYASPRSAGIRVPYASTNLTVRALRPGDLGRHDLVVFCASATLARLHVPDAVLTGAVVVDASSAFREDPTVPLVIPEINAHLLDAAPRLVASPNCSATILLTALEPIRRAYGITAITVSTYQAVSGAGQRGLDELRAGAAAALVAHPESPSVFPEPCAFNCFSHNSAVDPDSGLNVEERKIITETRRIWNAPDLPINPTCIRVPVERAHSESVTVELSQPASEHHIRELLAFAPGVRVIDDRAANRFPTPRAASGLDEVLVGRIRPVPHAPRDHTSRSRAHNLWICGDQLRKGAALNALQIARILRPALCAPPTPISRAAITHPAIA